MVMPTGILRGLKKGPRLPVAAATDVSVRYRKMAVSKQLVDHSKGSTGNEVYVFQAASVLGLEGQGRNVIVCRKGASCSPSMQRPSWR